MLSMLLLAAGLALPTNTACGVLADYWENSATCVEVTGPALHYGELTLDQVRVEVTGTDISAGAETGSYAGVRYRVRPLASAGYYSQGVIPACRAEDGSLTRAGAGGLEEQFPGHYYLHQSSDNPVQLNFDQYPCVYPSERVLVAVGGYSSVAVVPAADVGWTAGSTVGPWSVTVTSPAYGVNGTVTYKVSQTACTGSFTGNLSSHPCFVANLKDWSLSVRAYKKTGVSVGYTGWSAAAFASRADNGVYRSSLSESASVTGSGFDYLVFTWTRPDGSSVNSYYYPEGNSLRPGQSAGFDYQAMVVRDAELDKVIYTPGDVPFQWLEGQCDTIDCVGSYCSDVGGIDVVGFLGCFFRFDVSLPDWYSSLWQNVQQSNLWVGVTYSLDLLRSYPSALVAKDGACGMLFEMTSGPLSGLNGDTCSLPMPDTVRSIAAALVYLAAGMAILRMITQLMVEGNPGYFGFGKRGEEQGTLW